MATTRNSFFHLWTIKDWQWIDWLSSEVINLPGLLEIIIICQMVWNEQWLTKTPVGWWRMGFKKPNILDILAKWIYPPVNEYCKYSYGKWHISNDSPLNNFGFSDCHVWLMEGNHHYFAIAQIWYWLYTVIILCIYIYIFFSPLGIDWSMMDKTIRFGFNRQTTWILS